MNETEFIDRVRSAGWSYNAADAIREFVDECGIGVARVTPHLMQIVLGNSAANRRKAIGRKHSARMVLRHRRAYNHDLALRLRHEREVLWFFDGTRCYTCRHIAPQPGEVMVEGWEAGL